MDLAVISEIPAATGNLGKHQAIILCRGQGSQGPCIFSYLMLGTLGTTSSYYCRLSAYIPTFATAKSH